jgi:hypothetical protein
MHWKNLWKMTILTCSIKWSSWKRSRKRVKAGGPTKTNEEAQ